MALYLNPSCKTNSGSVLFEAYIAHISSAGAHSEFSVKQVETLHHEANMQCVCGWTNEMNQQWLYINTSVISAQKINSNCTAVIINNAKTFLI